MRFGLFVVFSSVAIAGFGAEIIPVLTLSSEEISHGDPLFIQVTLTNASRETILINKPLGAEYGSVLLKAREVQSGVSSDLRVPNQGRSSPEVPPFSLESRSKVSSLEILFLDERQRPYLSPGTFDLIAQISLLGRTYTTKPVRVTVVKAEEDQSRILGASAPLLSQLLVVGSIGLDDSKLGDVDDLIIKRLSAGSLRNAVSAYSEILRNRKEFKKLEQQAVAKFCDSITSKVDDVTGAALRKTLFLEFLNAQRPDLARTLYSAERDSDYTIQSVASQLKQQ